MSTTWVFLGLLAGREFAMSMIFDEVNKHRTSRNVSKDAMKLMFGLFMSVFLATILPWFYNFVTHYGQYPHMLKKRALGSLFYGIKNRV